MTRDPVRRFRSSGGEIAYTDQGDGEAVLLLHGFPLSSFSWRTLAPVLAQRLRVIAPDLLGYGRSGKPAGAPLDIRAQAGYMLELLEHLGIDRVGVVGHAEGGGVAQRLALEGFDVAAMVLVSSIAFDASPVGPTRDVQRLDPAGLDRHLVAERMQSTVLTGVADPANVTDDVIEGYSGPWVDAGGPAAFVRAARALDGEGLTGHEQAFASWAFPIILLWGEEDPWLPPSLAERLHDALPSSALGLLPGVGHFVLDEAAPTVVPMIAEWLRAAYLRAPHAHDLREGVVMLQLERRSALEDLAEHEAEDPPVRFDPDEQEIGRHA